MNFHKRKRSTQVVNIYASSYDVYTGSPQTGADPRNIPPGQYGFLGNPFQDSSDPEEGVEMFREYFIERVGEDRRFRLAVIAIWGKRLGCFCEEGGVCHADVVAEWLEGQRKAHHKLLGTHSESR